MLELESQLIEKYYPIITAKIEQCINDFPGKLDTIGLSIAVFRNGDIIDMPSSLCSKIFQSSLDRLIEGGVVRVIDGEYPLYDLF